MKLSALCVHAGLRAITHHRNQIFIQSILGDAVSRSRAQGLCPRFILLISRQSQNACGGVDLPYLSYRGESRRQREIQVHEGNVRAMLFEGLNAFFGGSYRSNQFHVGMKENQQGKTFAEQRILIHCKNANPG